MTGNTLEQDTVDPIMSLTVPTRTKKNSDPKAYFTTVLCKTTVPIYTKLPAQPGFAGRTQ